MQYPQVVKVFPYLIASRERSFEVLTDITNFICDKFDFSIKKPTADEAQHLAAFIIKSGLGKILSDRYVKNLYDYVVGVEVGLDSNGRKNRGGTTMEFIVSNYIKQIAKKYNCQYIEQATAKKISQYWGVDIAMDKSSRIVDFAINKDGKLYLIEVNFYSGGGSKLKSTATEYVEMYKRYHSQNIEFIWITDGAGWQSTLKPLREYFDKSDYLLSLSMLHEGILDKIISL